MGWFYDVIFRKFNNIVGIRYEEIFKVYENFFLIEEELVILEINFILFVFDRFFEKVLEEVYEIFLVFEEVVVWIVYVIDEGVFKMICEIFGEEVVEEFRKKEMVFVEIFFKEVEEKLGDLNIKFSRKIVFGDKVEYVEGIVKKYDLFVIFCYYGFEMMRIYCVSFVVFRIV